MFFPTSYKVGTTTHFKGKEAQIRLLIPAIPIYIRERCNVFLTFSTGSTVKGRLRIAEKIVNETRLNGFFALVVAS